MNTEIKANLKQLTIKGTETTAQFVVATGAKGFNDLSKMAGQTGALRFESDQQEIPMDVPEGQTTINNIYVSQETGEVTDMDTYQLPGGDE